MEINVPINEKSNVLKLIELGADQFYLGYLLGSSFFPRGILSRHKDRKANFKSIEAASDSIQEIINAGKKVSITLNEYFYPESVLKEIMLDIKKLLNLGVSSFIVADINLLISARQKFPNLNLIASTTSHITNSKSVKFFKNFGIKRIVLPRNLLISEIKEIIGSDINMEFEIIVKNCDCANIEGLCSYLHGEIDNYNFSAFCNRIKYNNSNVLLAQRLDEFACAACGLFELKKMHAKSKILKIAGRSNCYNNTIEKDVFFFNILRKNNSIKDKLEFQRYTKLLFKKIYGHSCMDSCYYDINGVV